MNITFHAIGLRFDADVTYTPAIPASRTEPLEPAECQINTLTHLNKSLHTIDCMFLFDSEAQEEIELAAEAECDRLLANKH